MATIEIVSNSIPVMGIRVIISCIAFEVMLLVSRWLWFGFFKKKVEMTLHTRSASVSHYNRLTVG